MHTHAVKDLAPDVAYKAFLKLRKDTLRIQNEEETESEGTLRDAALTSGMCRLLECSRYSVFNSTWKGGRLAYMSRLARSAAGQMEHSIKRLKQGEHAWLRTNTGLIPDCDDDVMDEV
jgi:hypothetical protein